MIEPVLGSAGISQASFLSTFPFDVERIGAAAVYCSDGRYGEQFDEFLHQGLGLPRYDRVAVPGGAGVLAGHVRALRENGAMEKQLRFLIEAHELRRVVLVAHQDCGFYKELRLRNVPIEHQQREDLKRVGERIRQWQAGVGVEAYFARRVENRVQFERVVVE